MNNLQDKLAERNRDIEKMRQEQQMLEGIIKSLEKDISTLKTEIQERDNIVQDKVRNWTID